MCTLYLVLWKLRLPDVGLCCVHAVPSVVELRLPDVGLCCVHAVPSVVEIKTPRRGAVLCAWTGLDDTHYTVTCRSCGRRCCASWRTSATRWSCVWTCREVTWYSASPPLKVTSTSSRPSWPGSHKRSVSQFQQLCFSVTEPVLRCFRRWNTASCRLLYTAVCEIRRQVAYTL